MGNLFPILIGTIFINNLALTKLVSVGQLANLGDNEEDSLAIGISAALIMGISSVLAYVVYQYVLVNAGLTVLNLLVYAIIVYLVMLLVSRIFKTAKPLIYERVKGILPILTINSAVFYLLLDNINQELDFGSMLLTSIGAPIGLLLAFVIYGAVKERLAVSEVPQAFKGLPILLIFAALALLAISGLGGIV
ncbi:MAG: Rnf-Nqr domain containing protein [Clostridiaceae bacterium]